MNKQQQQLSPAAAIAAPFAPVAGTPTVPTATVATTPSAKTASPSTATAAAAGSATPKAVSTPRSKASPTRLTPKARSWSDANGTPRSSNKAANAAAAPISPITPPNTNSTDSSSVTTGIENVMDDLMAQYLRKRGYHVVSASEQQQQQHHHQQSEQHSVVATAVAEPSLSTASVKQEQLVNRNGVKAMTSSSISSPVGVESAGRLRANSDERRRFLGDPADALDTKPTVTIEQYARTLGLSTESCAANHILFYGLTNGDPTTYERAYSNLLEWICNALDLYKYELHALAYPVFAHCFLELVAKGFGDAARRFLMTHARDHTRLHLYEVRQLSLVFTQSHLHTNEYALQLLQSKFNIHISLLSFQLLQAFLSASESFLLLAIVNERVNLIVTTTQPGMELHALEDEEEEEDVNNDAVVMSLERREATRSYKTSDQVARVIAASTTPDASAIGVPLTSGGAYNLAYVVQAAAGGGGGKGETLEALHAVEVRWGVLRARRLHVDVESDKGDNTVDESHGNGARAIATSDGNVHSDAASDKKSGQDVSAASASSTSAAASGSSSAKAAGGAANVSTTTTDAQRKLKRAKLSPLDSRIDSVSSALEAMGPVPDRRARFNAEILEKLVLRQPTEMKICELEDLRARTRVSKTQLPSALAFTVVNNPSVHVNSMCVSDDVTMVGAACADASFRVWRNDDQPLGTAKGAVYHGANANRHDEDEDDEDDDDDDDEKTAVLRGHASAVYGARFSPDNRFALTGGADATVRLWSLASKTNLVTYRSHAGLPVWDVAFGPFGYYFASCSMDRTARLWSTDRMAPLRVLAGHLSDVDCVEFHPNHNYIATGSSDKTVRLWDVQTGTCVRIFTGHFHGVQSLAFSRNGRFLASSGDDCYINVWDLQAGKRLETLVGHSETVTSLSFSQESAVLASCSMDATVRLWDMHALVEKTIATTGGGTGGSSGSGDRSVAGLNGSNKPATGYSRPIHMVRASALHDLPPSRYLLQTLRSKQTPMYNVHFTARNLLLAGGVFHPQSDASL